MPLNLLQPLVPSATLARLWGQRGFRVFLSHKSSVKRKVSELKEGLEFYGASCFVAHQSIRPTKAWQDEIESALRSMDAFVAVLTKGFHDSYWTDQEVGFALATGVPIVAVRLGMDPYGFLGKFQALSSDWQDAPIEIVRVLLRHGRMVDAFIDAVERSRSFDDSNRLSEVLPAITRITRAQAARIVRAFNDNYEVSGSFGFTGGRPRDYGEGLANFLHRRTGIKYTRLEKTGRLRRA